MRRPPTAAAVLLSFLYFFAASATALEVSISTEAFRGESCRQCHAALRDRKPGALALPGTPPSAGFYDAIIVGGGLSGLIAAYYLRDYRILVLDKEPKAGGQARRESFDGHLYPSAGAYLRSPEGAVRDLLKSLGLKIQRIALISHTMNFNGTIVPEWLPGKPDLLPYSAPAKARIRNMQDFLRRFGQSREVTIPLEDSKPGALEKYERNSLRQFIDNEFGTEAAELADIYARGVFGVSGDGISASAGLSFLASEFSPIYSWEGGLGAASEALSDAVGPALSTGAFVWRVSQDLDGATVDFSQNGRDYEARSRAVVFAVPSLVSRRIAAGLTEEKREAMSKVRYSSSYVVPMRTRRVLWKDSFVYWTPARSFTGLTMPLPDYDLLKDATSQVLVAHVPMDAPDGRRALLSASDQELVAPVLADMDTVFDRGASSVAQARVIRWGHAIPIPYPGYLTQVRPQLAKPDGRYFFAGVETQIPSFEGAVYSGLYAAVAARKFLKTRESGPPASSR